MYNQYTANILLQVLTLSIFCTRRDLTAQASLNSAYAVTQAVERRATSRDEQRSPFYKFKLRHGWMALQPNLSEKKAYDYRKAMNMTKVHFSQTILLLLETFVTQRKR